MFGIAALFGKIFGTEKALEKVVDGAASALDKLVYTDEEEADDVRKSRSEARKMVIEWMKTTKGQNLARRFLALIITAVWLFQYITGMILDLSAIWATNPEKLTQAAKVLGDRADGMTGAMMLILGFYFAAPHMGSIATAALQRFGNGQSK